MARRFLPLILTIIVIGGILGTADVFFCVASASVGSADQAQACLEKVQAGENALAVGNYNEAISSFKTALAIRNDHFQARFRLAQALVKTGRFEESFPHFEALLNRDPNNIQVRLVLCRALINSGRSEEANTHLNWILKVQPSNREAAELLASTQPEGCKDAKDTVDADAAFPRVTTIVNMPTRGAPKQVKAAKMVKQASVGSDREVVPAGFQPLQVQQVESASDKADKTAESQSKASRMRPMQGSELVPPMAASVSGWRVSDFMAAASSSLPILLDYATYCLEKDDLKRAAQYLERAEGLAVDKREMKRFLETQIHKSLLTLYQRDVSAFGKQLIKVKPMLSRETYVSFLDIYNKVQNASSAVDLARIIAGVAMGAEHYAVAERLLIEVVQAAPEDLFAARMLSEAQLQNRDFAGAEKTLKTITARFPNDSEAHFNLARFYLTARFEPELAKSALRMAESLNKNDSRIAIVSSLIDYAQGDLKSGLARLKKELPKIKDSNLRAICQRIIADGEAAARPGGPAIDFAGLLALPGSPAAAPQTVNLLGEAYLKRGSFFSALRCFMESRDLAEIGRTYLAIASSLAAAGEANMSAAAAGHGLNALQEELKKNPFSARAHLYLALYYYERRDFKAASREAQRGISGGADGATQKQLKILLENMQG